MDTIQINAGEKRIAINDDPNRVIVFNPFDAVFAERFYKVIAEFETKAAEYKARYKELAQRAQLDAQGVPVNMQEQIELLKETCMFVRGRIDYVFGAGTAQMVFGDAMVLNAFEQFFAGIAPFIQDARAEKIQKYLPANGNGHNKKAKPRARKKK